MTSKKEKDSQVVDLFHCIELFTHYLNEYVIEDSKIALGTGEIFDALRFTNLILVNDDDAVSLAMISRMEITIKDTDDPKVKEIIFGNIIVDED